MCSVALALTILIGTVCHCKFIPENETEISNGEHVLKDDLGEYGDHYEGDMILLPDQKGCGPMGRNGKTDARFRWPDATVYYEISNDFNRIQIYLIKVAMNIIEHYTCVRYVERNASTVDYVSIGGKFRGCYSHVGRIGGRQETNYDARSRLCFQIGSLIHEMIHVLGFHHQQSSPERDDYIKILEENIMDGAFKNFKKYDSEEVSNFGVEYDYDSVMHYESKAFSKNNKNTIIPLRRGVRIGQRTHISLGDIKKINRMYNCYDVNSQRHSTPPYKVDISQGITPLTSTSTDSSFKRNIYPTTMQKNPNLPYSTVPLLQKPPMLLVRDYPLVVYIIPNNQH